MKVVTLMSGGLDSTTLVAKLLHQGHEVVAVGINYGQRHAKELNAARAICKHYDIPYRIVDMENIATFLHGSSQTDPNVPVPHGHYAAENMKATIVPNRNMMMLSIATAIALAEDCQAVAFAAHSGDHAIYPDCRPEFVDALRVAIKQADHTQIDLLAPFIDISKTDIAALGFELNAPLRLTWSCYEGNEVHCGKCGTCVERIEAFTDAGVPDPTQYAEG